MVKVFVMKNKKILLCLIPILMTACAEPTLVSDTDIVTPATNTKTEIDSTEIDSVVNIDTSEESVIDETKSPRAMAPRMCSVHVSEYHFSPGELIDYIGEEFYDWVYSEENKPDSDLTDDCPYSHCNIIECLKYFDISEEEFTEMYYKLWYYSYQYAPNIMYSGNSAEIQDFFLEDMSGKENSEYINRSNIWSAKLDLRLKLSDMAVDEQIIEKYQELPLTAWTFTDIIRDAQISRSTFEEFLAEPNSRSFRDAFDVDAIYEQVEAMDDITLAEMNTAYTEESLLDKCLDNIAYEMQFLVGE